MVWLLEMPRPAQPAELRKLTAQFPKWQVVFVHSYSEFAPMVAAPIVFEALPPLSMIGAHPGLMNWHAWVQDRHALLLAKWAPDRAVSYGMPFETYADQVIQFDVPA